MCSIFTKEIQMEYNIIGVFDYKDKEDKNEDKNDKDKEDEDEDKNDEGVFNEEVKEVKEVKEEFYKKRNKGFEILSNKKEISNQLKKSKFCDIKIKYGHCYRKLCNFAHFIDELVFPKCAFGDNCKKQKFCTFLHPNEPLEKYKVRINFTEPSFLY